MPSRTAALLAALTVATLAAAPAAQAHDDHHAPRLKGQRVGYFTQWGIYSGFSAKKVQDSGQAGKLTVINYAFGNVSSDGTCFEANAAGVGDAWADYQRPVGAEESVDGVADTAEQPLKGNFNQLRKLKAKNPQLKSVISLGGWSWSKYFSDAALTDASRKKFVASCIDLYIKGNLPQLGSAEGGAGAGAGAFDGIDIDWEYPGGGGDAGNIVRPEDGRNYTLLMQEFRKQLDALSGRKGPHYLLTAAVASNEGRADQLELRKVAKSVDWLNLMTYDLHGSWDTLGPTNHNANLYADKADPATDNKFYSVDRVVQHYLDNGLPADKAVLGVPFYGYGWTGVPAGTRGGLFQPATGLARGGTLPYNQIKDLPGKVGYDRQHGATWKYDGTEFWSFDTPELLTRKAEYSRWNDLAGVMAWALDNDDAQGSLMKALDKGLQGR
ncbi:glycoside hydrolase family 18 protein [Kitasatospora sp. NBC_00240]|uniref:glycoside hydrolase family 18 protein n=1 Tax=Kitasatospora sp. NBC_00240 TaxID=2903567 RepID=UPI00224D7AAF|nr:glycoside hydrolase family 18 protein [Kitasatospora sp. NBC_00240]MCX5212917.1 glycoside hydrolase family 18 protein [Kitasatospora sp. NBC_00240]